MGLFLIHMAKTAICLALFYLFYKLLLSKDTFHRFNRIALLSLLLMAIVLPFVRLSLPVTPQEEPSIEMSQIVTEQEPMVIASQTSSAPEQTAVPWTIIFLTVYLASLVLFVGRFIWMQVRLYRLIRRCRTVETDGQYTLYVHKEDQAPFSWMSYIFISEKDLSENGPVIIAHELAHIQQRHSLDLLLAEISLIFQWFNPAAWLIKQELQSIHEFEADDVVLKQGIDAKKYQLLIIKKAVGTRLYSMANSLNHSSLKKRITMMLKEKSHPWARLKYVCFAPAACFAVLAFAHPDVNQLEQRSNERFEAVLNQETPSSLDQPTTNKGTNKLSEITTLAVKNNQPKFTTPPVKNDLADSKSLKDAKPLKDNEPLKDTQLSADNQQKATTDATIMGKVIAKATGKALPSVSVAVVNASNRIIDATRSGDDGSFTVQVKHPDDMLQFSCIGYKSVTIPSSKYSSTTAPQIHTNGSPNKSMTVALDETVMELAETIVVGYALANQEKKVKETPKDEYLLVEKLASFPGGEEALIVYLANNILYPKGALERGAEGRVVCSCVISTTGKITDVVVTRLVDHDLDAEAMRVILNMPNWLPALQNGRPVPVKVSIPITFRRQTD